MNKRKKKVLSAKHPPRYTNLINNRKVQNKEREMWIKLKRKCNINGIKLTTSKHIQREVLNKYTPEQVDMCYHIAIKTDIPFEDLPF